MSQGQGLRERGTLPGEEEPHWTSNNQCLLSLPPARTAAVQQPTPQPGNGSGWVKGTNSGLPPTFLPPQAMLGPGDWQAHCWKASSCRDMSWLLGTAAGRSTWGENRGIRLSPGYQEPTWGQSSGPQPQVLEHLPSGKALCQPNGSIPRGQDPSEPTWGTCVFRSPL